MHRGTLAPRGTVREGAVADAAQERTFADLVEVRGLADTLQESAAIARRGADQLDYLKRRAVDAINNARDAGLAVGEDLSVTDTSKFGGLRVGLVQQHAATIASRAIALSTADNEIAGKITTATAVLNNHGFIEPPEDKTVQTVGYSVGEAPTSPFAPVECWKLLPDFTGGQYVGAGAASRAAARLRGREPIYDLTIGIARSFEPAAFDELVTRAHGCARFTGGPRAATSR